MKTKKKQDWRTGFRHEIYFKALKLFSKDVAKKYLILNASIICFDNLLVFGNRVKDNKMSTNNFKQILLLLE